MKTIAIPSLPDFIAESNRIEGISGAPKMEPSYAFLSLDEPTLDNLCGFVRDEAGAELRTQANMNVMVGNHRPPPGGPEIAIELRKLILLAIDNDACMDDVCTPNGCTNDPISCEDGDACTDDGCDPGSSCTHTTTDCNDGDACNGEETCNSADGCHPPHGPQIGVFGLFSNFWQRKVDT